MCYISELNYMPKGIYKHPLQCGFQKGHKGFYEGGKMSEEHKKKISESNKGVKRSFETRKKMSLARKGRKPMLGKHHSEETRKKMIKNHADVKMDKHPNWQGGKSFEIYPKEFNKELKLKIRQRDNFICCLCQRTEREELEELNRVLAVNHIDFNKQNYKENNLNTLCMRCNVKINRERDYWTNYFRA